MDEDLHKELLNEHEVVVEDHISSDEEGNCGFCGHTFIGAEARIEKSIYGQKWVFCSEECLESFQEKSNYKDEDPDMTTGEEDETGFEVQMSFTGPEGLDDDD